MLLKLLGRDEEALLVWTLNLILQVAAVSCAKLGICDGCELALSLLPLDVVLTYNLGLRGKLFFNMIL